jgi:hypothetical protein
MIWPQHQHSVHGSGEFARARAQAEIETMTLRIRAARTVAGQAIDGEDLSRLLSMLGLEHPAERRER